MEAENCRDRAQKERGGFPEPIDRKFLIFRAGGSLVLLRGSGED
jgi:hypothetical protein